MIAKFAVAWTLTVSVFCSGPAAADDCRRVNLDDQHPTAVIGTQPKLNNFGPGAGLHQPRGRPGEGSVLKEELAKLR